MEKNLKIKTQTLGCISITKAGLDHMLY